MKKFSSNLFILLLLVTSLAGSFPSSVFSADDVEYTWAGVAGGVSSDESFSSVIDSSGNLYTVGHFLDTVDFDPGAGTTNLVASGAGYDVFITKLNSAGELVWAKNFGNSSDEFAYGIDIDSLNNIYITGTFLTTVDFDPGAGDTSLTSSGGRDIFVSKFDSNGIFVWAKNMGGGSNDDGYSISVDGIGAVYTTGRFLGTADFDPGAGDASLTSAGGTDIFISKLDTSGTFVWAQKIGGIGADIGLTTVFDPNGAVYTKGRFTGTVDFDPGAGTNDLTASGGADTFLVKLDSDDGTFVWAETVGGVNFNFGKSLAADTSGNVYNVGYFYGTVDFDPGAGDTSLVSAGDADASVAKFDSTGGLLWAKNMGGTAEDYTYSVELDADGNVYIVGYFNGTADFDPGAGTTNLISAGDTEAFVAKLDSTGGLLWAKSFSGAGFDYASAVNIGADGNVYTTGVISDTTDFDPGAGTVNLGSNGGTDIFFSRLSPIAWTVNLEDDSANRTTSGSRPRIKSGNIITSSGADTSCSAGESFSSTTGLPCSSSSLGSTVTCPLVLTLRKGSMGEEVKCLQTRLNVLYNQSPLVVDGVFGSKTNNAVVLFQRDNLLAPDGIVGPLTRAKVNR